MAGNLVKVVKCTLQSVFDYARQNTRHATREVARSHSSCILSFDLIGQHRNKRFHVTEIISGSQTLFFGGREATTENTSAVRRLMAALCRGVSVMLFRHSRFSKSTTVNVIQFNFLL